MTMVNDINGFRPFDVGDYVMYQSPGNNQLGRVFGYHRFDDRCPNYSDACYPFCPQFDGQEVEQ